MIERQKKVQAIALILLGVLVVLSLLAASSRFLTSPVIAQNEPSSALPENPEATKIFTCNIVELALHTPSRFHIRCNPGDAGIAYFAASTAPTEIARTNEFITLANTAFALGKTINIWYDTDQTKNPPGCLVGDCRKIIALVLRP